MSMTSGTSRDRGSSRLAGKRTCPLAQRREQDEPEPGLDTEPKAEDHMPRVGFPLSSVYQRLYYPFFTRTVVLQVELYYKATTWPTSIIKTLFRLRDFCISL